MLKALADRAGQTGARGSQRVAAAGFVNVKIAEGGDAADGVERGRAGQGAGAGIVVDGEGDARMVRGDQVAEHVEHLHNHGRADRSPRHGITRLTAGRDDQVMRRRRRDVEGARTGAGERAGAGSQRVAGTDLAEGEICRSWRRRRWR